MSSIQHKRAWHARKQERMIFSEELEQFIEPVFACPQTLDLAQTPKQDS